MPGSSELRALGVVAFLASTVAACGNSPAGGGSGGGGGGAAGAGGSLGSAGGSGAGTGGTLSCGVASGGQSSGTTCNAIAASGPCVTATFSPVAAPTPAGGAFAGGTYNLVSEILYGPAGTDFLSGQPFQQTYVLSDVTSTSFTLDQVEILGTVVARSHETAAVAGMTATFSQSCPDPDAGIDWGGSYEFTATPSSITLFRSVNGVTGVVEVRVYDSNAVP
jgi:hypothetical protein